jgi:hypothetical protein
MGFRIRKSISLGKLLKLNISKSGIGVSGGIKGVRLSVAPDGKVRGSVGLPGTGVSYTKVLGDITPSKKKEPAKAAIDTKTSAAKSTAAENTTAKAATADDAGGAPPATKGAAKRFCTSCGKRAGADDKFCRYCGARVPTQDPDEE